MQRLSKDLSSASVGKSTVLDLSLGDVGAAAQKASKEIRYAPPEFNEKEQKVLFFQGKKRRKARLRHFRHRSSRRTFLFTCLGIETLSNDIFAATGL